MSIVGAPLPLPSLDIANSPFLAKSMDAPPGTLMFDDLQLEWRGMLFGRGTWMSWQDLVGWDTLGDIDNGSVPRIYQHGSYPGRMRVLEKTLEFTTYSSVGRPDFDVLWPEIMKRTIPEDVERPLVVRLNGRIQMVWARISGREADIDLSYFMGFPAYKITWALSDPRRYAIMQQSAAGKPPHSVGGLGWDTGLNWSTGLDWGTSAGGTLSIYNQGGFDTPLNINFQGALTPPFYLRSPYWSLGFSIPVAESEVLQVDTLNGTAMISGVDRSYALTDDSDLIEDCSAPPNEVLPLTVTTSDSSDTGQVSVQWRDTDL